MIIMMCHFKDASSKTIKEIMQWSLMECSDPELTHEIQKLGTRLKLLISHPTPMKRQEDNDVTETT